ncbi:TrbC/VirB2 family protein [Lactobacillus jensenii]|uniref:TrbC/VirB2 family protein n=1 Tax=Lactobacillus jensenii TaxID=109790 RepID=UPI0022AC68EE|nr:TrbC/VirB2 family protein [Lactobacillus jensenii]MCZ3724184.1 TrbC/VirB2 family protein [Lactobacillus jensenii]MCZ3725707.1 TrbC/VirB2 family protein [Lactobacillus jensenii]MCZ3727147.1 TrbC/VirB2 family protein [Lactobacillus jensenii]MCZ3728707.1 TrbC/VirB2 family protein [Lactobacillus jensenii]MCZ3730265.1 TrbC/VirB2 family protein [Lactobacillus jensenii]
MLKLLSNIYATDPVLLDSSVWSRVQTGAQNVTSNVTTTSRYVAIAVFAIVGLIWVFGGQNAQKAKAWLGAALIGSMIIILAPQIVPWIFSMFGGATF